MTRAAILRRRSARGERPRRIAQGVLRALLGSRATPTSVTYRRQTAGTLASFATRRQKAHARCSLGRRGNAQHHGRFRGGAVIGTLAGPIGSFGGAEFRLLIGAFLFATLQAVVLDKAMCLVVVASALPFRAATVSPETVAAQWPVILNLLAAVLLLSAVKAWRHPPG